MSGLLNDIRAEHAAMTPIQCPIGRALARLDKQDQDDLLAALDDQGLSHVAITRALENRGLVSHGSVKGIAAHRKGECSCARR